MPCVSGMLTGLQYARERASQYFQGGGVASGGLRELIPTVARTAVAVGIDGIFVEVSCLTPVQS